MPLQRLHKRSFGKFTDQHPAFSSVKTRDNARTLVNRLLRDAAKAIALPLPNGFSPATVKISASNKLENFGRWYQVNQGEFKFLTAAPPSVMIWDNEDLLRLLLIREELFPQPAGRLEPSPGKQKEITQHNHNLQLLAPYAERLERATTPSNTLRSQDTSSSDSDITFDLPTNRRLFASGSQPAPSRAPKPHPTLGGAATTEDPRSDGTGRIELQVHYKPSVHVFYWEELGLACQQATLYPDKSGFTRLSTSRIALGKAGIELLTKVERYIFEEDKWMPFPRALPIGPVEGPGYPILLRSAGLPQAELLDFNEMVEILRIQFNRPAEVLPTEDTIQSFEEVPGPCTQRKPETAIEEEVWRERMGDERQGFRNAKGKSARASASVRRGRATESGESGANDGGTKVQSGQRDCEKHDPHPKRSTATGLRTRRSRRRQVQRRLARTTTSTFVCKHIGHDGSAGFNGFKGAVSPGSGAVDDAEESHTWRKGHHHRSVLVVTRLDARKLFTIPSIAVHRLEWNQMVM
ncbi:hypothetical protein NMY22_g13218 [Coprinellus aureogranulatus]|nr:hypothetical protein NMY22_g13218 [Coprinellus aureogranulatus]